MRESQTLSPSQVSSLLRMSLRSSLESSAVNCPTVPESASVSDFV